MAETLTQKTMNLISSAKERRFDDPLESFLLIQQAHKMLSEVNGFRRTLPDFKTARDFYEDRVMLLLCELSESTEELGIATKHYDRVLLSPQERGRITYDAAMNF